MKKLILAFLIFLCGTVSGQLYQQSEISLPLNSGQSKEAISQQSLKESNFLKKKLKLSNDQYLQINQINTDFLKDFNRMLDKTLSSNQNIQETEDFMLKEAKKLIAIKDQKLKILFTEKQWQIYQAKKDVIEEKFLPGIPVL